MLDFYYENVNDIIEFHHKKSVSEKQGYHLHEQYEIYYLVNGSLSYFVNQSTYNINSGELLIVNSTEIHTHSLHKDKDYERILILFDPEVARQLSPLDFNLLTCFIDRLPGEANKIRLTPVQQQELMHLFHKLALVNTANDAKSKVLRLAFFIEVLVLINEAFKNDFCIEDIPILSDKLRPILEYINLNISEDLSLITLEKIFFINRFYLSRLFKDNTGISIHQYIILKRLLKARMLMRDGYDVTKACYASGFKDYSNFIKIFKKNVGILPSEYKKHPF